MSERVRMARALDAVENNVGKVCELAVERIAESNHLQVELAFDIGESVREVAELYSVDLGALEKETMLMLKDGLNRSLRPLYEVRYVKPFVKGGVTVGMTVRVYKFERRIA